jgi:amidase
MSELWKLPGYEIAELVKSRQISAVEVTKAHLERLAEVNPKLNAVVQEMPEEAIEDAKEIDRRSNLERIPVFYVEFL